MTFLLPPAQGRDGRGKEPTQKEMNNTTQQGNICLVYMHRKEGKERKKERKKGTNQRQHTKKRPTSSKPTHVLLLSSLIRLIG